MPNWPILRGREPIVDIEEVNEPPVDIQPEGAIRRKTTTSRRRDTSMASPEEVDNLQVFRSQTLEGTGEIVFKVSAFQRSRRYHAELRGCTLVAFRSSNIVHAQTVGVDDVVAVMPVHEYKIEITKLNDGKDTTRIYFNPDRYPDSMVMYVVISGEVRANAWRRALAKVTPTPLPCLSSMRIESVIGRGGGGKVFVVRSLQDESTFALKVIDKSHTLHSSKAFRHVASERVLMENIGAHPFLLPMKFAFQSDTNLFIGTPFCAGGDLASYIRAHGIERKPDGTMNHSPRRGKKPLRRLAEEQTRLIMAEVLLGLEHLHSRGIVYRDLKPENILIDETGHIQVADYGLAKQLTINFGGQMRKTHSVCGTRNYIPPEMLDGALYSFEVDTWSFGVMLYRMLVGGFPFEGRRTREIFDRIKREPFNTPSWISDEARDLISILLQKRPENRADLPTLKQHPFFKDIDWDEIYNKDGAPCIPDVEAGLSLADALENFELSRLGGVTVGEYVSETHNLTRAVSQRERTNSRPSHRRDPRGIVIGFEYVCPKEWDEVRPLTVLERGGGLLARIQSEQLPLSPRSPFFGHGRWS